VAQLLDVVRLQFFIERQETGSSNLRTALPNAHFGGDYTEIINCKSQ
jgi:hypothetical protein